MNELSIVIPVFNNPERLKELLLRIEFVINNNNYKAEIIIVDDGSKDNKWGEIAKLKLNSTHRNCNLKIIRLRKNLSQSVATLYGIHHCKNSIIITMDADLQHLPEEIPALVKKLKIECLDLVYAVFENVESILNPSLIFRILTSKIGKKNYIYASSFRAIKKSIFEQALYEKNQHWFWVIDTLIQEATDKIGYQTVKKGRYLKSTYTTSKKIRLATNIIINSRNFYIFEFTLFTTTLLFSLSYFFYSYLNYGINLANIVAILISIMSSLIIYILYIMMERIKNKNKNKIIDSMIKEII